MERKLSQSTLSRNKKFFRSLSSCYQELIQRRTFLHWMRTIIEPRMGEKVLDLGNGGVREFFSRQTLLYVGVDLSWEMLKKGKEQTIQRICGEASFLPFKKEVFDTIFHRSLLHHLADKDIGRTMKRVKAVLHHESTFLKDKGNIIIIEPCLPVFWERIERIFFLILRAFFFLTRQPEIFLFSAESLISFLRESGYQEITLWEEDIKERSLWGWVTPSLGLSLFKIPRWLSPVRRVILEGKERSSGKE